MSLYIDIKSCEFLKTFFLQSWKYVEPAGSVLFFTFGWDLSLIWWIRWITKKQTNKQPYERVINNFDSTAIYLSP